MSAGTQADPWHLESEKQLDGRLLRRYVEQGAQDAFDSLVRRHLSFVYATCLREVSDPELAQDVTLAVFYILSRKASTLRSGGVLTSWLFQTARLSARNALRKERARMRLEQRCIQEAAEHQRHFGTGSDIWERIEPYLNGALSALRPRERDVLLLRYFDGLSLRETGIALGLTEDAARMRVTRALEKLRKHLANAGVTVSVAMLATILVERGASAAAPPSLLTLMLSARPAGFTTMTSLSARSLQISKGALLAMNGILSYATAITSIAIAVTLGGFGVIQTENIVNANRSFALQQEIEKSIRDSKSMAANWSTSYTMGGVSHTYGGTVTLKRPNMFQLKVGPPYNNSYISNGTEIQEHKWAGTEREEYKTVPLKPGETPTQLMDLSLAYLYMTADLNGFGRLLFQESPQMVDAGTEKRNGVTYRLLELRGSKDRHLVRLYILPNRLVAGMYTETESNTAEETPGGRVAKREWTTGLTFLRDIRIDKPVSETAFDFNKRPDTLVEKQSPMLIAGNQAPDFDVINPMDDKHISLSNLLQGKNAVLVNFWFSGCAPCREEFPHLQNLYNEFKDKGFDMIALDGSWADGSKVIRSFLTKNHYTFRAGLALHTQKRLEADDIAWRYGVQSYPSSFLVGANGRILWSGVGYDEKALRNALALAGLN